MYIKPKSASLESKQLDLHSIKKKCEEEMKQKCEEEVKIVNTMSRWDIEEAQWNPKCANVRE